MFLHFLGLLTVFVVMTSRPRDDAMSLVMRGGVDEDDKVRISAVCADASNCIELTVRCRNIY